MKRLLPILALCLLPSLGRAQVIVHQAALDQLAGVAPVSEAVPAPAPMIHRTVRRMAHRHSAAPEPAAVAFEHPPPPANPMAAPDKLRPPPPAAAPPAPAPPAPAAPAKTAAPQAHAVPVVLPVAPAVAMLHFAAGSADLTAGAAANLKPICTAAEPAGTVDVQAAAPASPGDPSIGMRLSMQRAFAVRDALAACGISPARIVPRAVGATIGGDLDAARISIGVPK